MSEMLIKEIYCEMSEGIWNVRDKATRTILVEDIEEEPAKELVRRWNAFEEGGLVDELRTALEGDFENCVPNVPMILSQALLGNYEAVKTMLRELSSINAKAIALAKS